MPSKVGKYPKPNSIPKIYPVRRACTTRATTSPGVGLVARHCRVAHPQAERKRWSIAREASAKSREWDPERVPGVDTIEALTSAVQAFDAAPLGLQVDPDAEAAVLQSVRRTGLLLLGETHGVAQTPVLLEELIARFGLGGIALEWQEDLGPWLDRWMMHGVLADPACGDPAMGVWGGDGRLTAGHLAALRRWAGSGLLITLMDGTIDVRPRLGEREAELGRRWWSERDAAMAGRVLAAPDAPGGRLVVAGNLHTRLEPLPVDHPIGPSRARLCRRRAERCCRLPAQCRALWRVLGPHGVIDGRLP